MQQIAPNNMLSKKVVCLEVLEVLDIPESKREELLQRLMRMDYNCIIEFLNILGYSRIFKSNNISNIFHLSLKR